ncbi:MAG: 16S rRNA (guanine(966)-N(2))-methyltransferase RsmD, partial [Acidobacteria bacterium]|nr:16S rRNA (guanine(966)-N(2))-methyltransferase RsmD [Acidobacteriota bacterium]
MRITGGIWRSRRLKGPGRGLAIRPTPDVLRERAFAVLADRVAGVRFLDLFAGTGAVSLEALSRGAAAAVLVESQRRAAAIIRSNLEALEVPAGRVRLLARPALPAVSSLARAGERFDLAWADPPFEAWEGGLEALEL